MSAAIKASREYAGAVSSSPTSDSVRDEVLAFFRGEVASVHERWVELMKAALAAEPSAAAELESDAMELMQAGLHALESGDYEPAARQAHLMVQRSVGRGLDFEYLLGSMLKMRNIGARSLSDTFGGDSGHLGSMLDVYEPMVDRILLVLTAASVEGRERLLSRQQDAIRELSTPVLRVRERLLILPIVGMIDTDRARQLTDQLLRSIRETRSKAVVIDITGVPAVDSKIANHLIQTVDAARLLGTTAILTGVAPEIAQTLVTIGVDLSKMITVGDLQGGIDMADQLLGYRVVLKDDVAAMSDE